MPMDFAVPMRHSAFSLANGSETTRPVGALQAAQKARPAPSKVLGSNAGCALAAAEQPKTAGRAP
jgi:hypothetical protein